MDLHRQSSPGDVVTQSERVHDMTYTAVDSHTSSAGKAADVNTTAVSVHESSTPDAAIFSVYEKLGWAGLTILAASTLLSLAALGFLWFLWEAGSSDNLWHTLAVKNRMSTAVALSAVVLRTCFGFSATLATSLLAGLALERSQVILADIASVSMARNSNSGPYTLSWKMIKGSWYDDQLLRGSGIVAIAILLAITTGLSQFTSTVLLHDLDLGLVPGLSAQYTTVTNFLIDNNTVSPVVSRGSTWNKQPPFYPAFAEWTGKADSAVNVVSTGPSYRALLPIPETNDREFLHNFTGVGTVIDSTVRCQRPNFTLPAAHVINVLIGLSGQLEWEGTDGPFKLTDFECLVPFPELDTASTEWPMTVCDLGDATRLKAVNQSVFRGSYVSGLIPEPDEQFGIVYLVLNLTRGAYASWHLVVGPDTGDLGEFDNAGIAPVAVQGREEWLDLFWTNNKSLALSATVCLANLDAADRFINVYSPHNVSEPSPRYDTVRQSFDYSPVRTYLGQSQSTGGFSSRGVWQLADRAWSPISQDPDEAGPNTTYGPAFIQNFARTSRVEGQDPSGYLSNGNTSNSILMLSSARTYQKISSGVWNGIDRTIPDPSHVGLFQEIMQTGGDIAFGIQSLLTTSATLSYYNQLRQFNEDHQQILSTFAPYLVPRSDRGLIAVTAIVGVHFFLVILLVVLFISKSRISTFANGWQVIAQVRGDAVDSAIDCSSSATDSTVRKTLLSGRAKEIAGLKLVGSGKTEVRLRTRKSTFSDQDYTKST